MPALPARSGGGLAAGEVLQLPNRTRNGHSPDLRDTDESRKVTQHWNVTFARQEKVSPMAKKILTCVLEQINRNEHKLQDYYQFKLNDLAQDTNMSVKDAREEVKKALIQLVKTVWQFQCTQTDKWFIRSLLDTSQDRAVGLDNGIITVIINPQLAPYLLQLTHFTRYSLGQFMHLKSWYSLRLYEILSAFKDTRVWHVSLDEYRDLMDCGPLMDKYGKPVKQKKTGSFRYKRHQTNKDLVRCTLQQPLLELSDTEVAFDYELTYAQEGTVGRPRVTGLVFRLTKAQDRIPETGMWKEPAVAEAVRLLRQWRVTDKNINLYLPAITVKRAHQLIYDWQLKENSSRRIDDKAKYCNVAFAREGQRALEELRKRTLAGGEQA